MQKVLDTFLEQLGAEGTTPPNTLSAYRTDLVQFVTFLADYGVTDADGLLPERVRAFYDWLHQRGYARSTIARRVAAIRAFGLYLTQAGILASNPTDGLRAPTKIRTQPQVLTVEQLQVLRTLPLREVTADGWRDHAMLEVLLATALRASDLVGLDVDDVSLESAGLTIRKRDGRCRSVQLSLSAVMALATYLQLGRPQLQREGTSEQVLFMNHQGQRLTRQGFWVIVKGYARQLQLEGVTPELLRQSIAAQRFADGAGVDEVQALLGHVTRARTKVYQHTVPLT